MTLRREPLLFAEVPGLRRLPFVPFTDVPTSVEPLSGYGDRVWLKRDDRISARYGGNKVRRFEFLFGRALDEGARTLVTVGGLASTQVTATIHFGRSVGLDVTAVLFDQPKSEFMREGLAVDIRAGGRLIHGGSYVRTARRFIEEKRRAFRPFAILPGASSPLCNLGYVDAMLELGAQVERGEMPRPDRIIVPCGSGGTVAGLTVGAAWLGWRTQIVGVRITDLIASNRATLSMLIGGTARLIARSGGPSRERLSGGHFEMDHRFIGPGYGYSTPEAEEGARKMGDVLGAPGEVTYSGKAFAGLVRQAVEHPKETILFWCTLSSRGRTPDKVSCPPEAPEEIRRLF